MRFRGGIDSARREVKASTGFYLKEALDALLQGKAPDPAEPKVLGCYLRLG